MEREPAPGAKLPSSTIASLAVLGIAALILLFGSAPLGVFLLLSVAGPLAAGLYLRPLGRVTQSLGAALNAASTGHLAQAEKLLDETEKISRLSHVRRAVALQRALFAAQRGEIESAFTHAGAAIDPPPGLFFREVEIGLQTSAFALRSFLRASIDDSRGAREDLARVRSNPDAPRDALARAALAEAVLLERAGNRSALREHLVEARRLLLEHTLPRERALVHAYQRALATRTGVYRQGAERRRPRAHSRDPAIANRVGDGAERAGRTTSPNPLNEASARQARRLKILFGILGGTLLLPFMMAGVIWWTGARKYHSLPAPQQAAPPDKAPAPQRPSIFSSWWFALLGGGYILAGQGAAIWMVQRRAKKLATAEAALARGEEDAALTMLQPLADAGRRKFLPVSLVGAQAIMLLATAAERRGDLPAALRLCDEGLVILGVDDQAMAQALGLLLPGLLAERAFLLAALGKNADADAQLDNLAARCPSYAFLATTRHRVALCAAAKRGDFADAARLVDRAGDLYLDPRDELLGDLASAVAAPDATEEGEIARLAAELRDEASRRWIEAVAPELPAAFSPMEQAADEALADEALAESEALAEADAEAELHERRRMR
jgi:tetratricopeptide (TPR) repeat protein